MKTMVLRYLLLITWVSVAYAFSCDSDEALLLSQRMYKTGMTCAALQSQTPVLTYPPYRDECKTYLGLDKLPASVRKAKINDCAAFPNGTLRYRARLCCATCNNAAADVVILMDDSGSVRKINFDNSMKTAVKAMITKFNIGSSATDGVQMAVVRFNSYAYTESKLNTYTTAAGLTALIGRIRYRGGGTRTDKALILADSLLYGTGARNVQKVVIALTDGNSNCRTCTLNQAARLRLKKVKIFAIGIGSGVSTSELLGMTGNISARVGRSNSFSDLTKIASAVSTAVCKEVNNPCKNNPCKRNGKCLRNNKLGYICVCPTATTGHRCETSLASCMATSDPHYQTFDGRWIHFQGGCTYNFASAEGSTAGFQVRARNEHRYGRSSVSYVKYVEVNLGNDTIRLGRNKVVSVNKARVYPNLIYPNRFSIINNGRFVRVEANAAATGISLAVEYDGVLTAFVRVPPSYSGKMSGICGDYNGDASNDLRQADGKDVRSSPSAHKLVGNSFKVKNDEDASTCEDTGPITKCTKYAESLAYSYQYCGLLKTAVFRAGSAAGVNVDALFTTCKYDVCANQNNLTVAREMACANLAAAAVLIESQGFQVNGNWRAKSGCNVKCPAGMTYSSNSTACPATCAYPKAPEECRYSNTESCACPAGKLLKRDKCVSPSQCGCSDSVGNTYDNGQNWLSDDCTKKYMCRMCQGCAVPKLIVTQYQCPGNLICGAASGSVSCVPNPCISNPCGNGGTCRVTKSGGYTCYCLGTRRWGSSCEPEDPCLKKPCKNGGVCSKTASGGFSCSCSGNWRGLTCTTIDGGWSKWSVWTLVGSGCENRIQTRDRKCDNPSPTPDGAPCNGSKTESRPCQSSAAEMKEPCNYCNKIDNKHGYLADPCSCRHYYQCSKQADGTWVATGPLPCGPCTRWSQADLTCVRTDDSCTTAPGTTIPVMCRLYPVPGVPTSYLEEVNGVNITRPCAPGTSFKRVPHCGCVVLGPVAPDPSSLIMCIKFDGDYSTSNYAWISKTNVELVTGGRKGGAVKFKGNGKIEIPFFNNMLGSFAQFSVSLYYKRTGGSAGMQPLVSNGLCKESSLELRSQSTSTAGGGVRTATGNYLNAYTSVSAKINDWNHLVLAYNGKTMSFYVNKQLSSQKSTSGGRLVSEQCPVVLGARYPDLNSEQYFTGLMDEVCFYKKSLTQQEVNAL